MTFHAVAAADEVPLKTARRIVIDGRTISLVHTEDGEFYAIDDRCSHADVSLSEGDLDGCTLECWLHGSAFDLRTGEPLALPAIDPIPTYPVRVSGAGDTALIEVDPTPILLTDRATKT